MIAIAPLPVIIMAQVSPLRRPLEEGQYSESRKSDDEAFAAQLDGCACRQSMRPSMRDIRCPPRMAPRVSATWSKGSKSDSLQVATREASMAEFSAPISLPAKSAFFRVSAIGRIVIRKRAPSQIPRQLRSRPSERSRPITHPWTH